MGKFGYLDSIILKDKEVMKEVKEVVHVPTRELAEEVLRVGAENGLYRFRLCLDEMIELYKEGLCICFNGQWMSKIGSPLTIDAKIITAQEFLDRYKDSEIDQLRKENEELRSINDTLNKENLKHHNGLTLLKEKLKAIEDTPKVGDVCLFWDGLNKYYSLEILSEIIKGKECIYRTHNNDEYTNCIKATPENIQAKIKELNND